jgi:hypothetical protein
MKREWYIQIDGKRSGPHSVAELKENSRITPDTLVWKEGFPKWVRIGSVKELAVIFKDRRISPRPAGGSTAQEEEEQRSRDIAARITPDGLVVDMRAGPPQLQLWLLLSCLLVAYLLYKLLNPTY